MAHDPGASPLSHPRCLGHQTQRRHTCSALPLPRAEQVWRRGDPGHSGAVPAHLHRPRPHSVMQVRNGWAPDASVAGRSGLEAMLSLRAPGRGRAPPSR